MKTALIAFTTLILLMACGAGSGDTRDDFIIDDLVISVDDHEAGALRLVMSQLTIFDQGQEIFCGGATQETQIDDGMGGHVTCIYTCQGSVIGMDERFYTVQMEWRRTDNNQLYADAVEIEQDLLCE